MHTFNAVHFHILENENAVHSINALNEECIVGDCFLETVILL